MTVDDTVTADDVEEMIQILDRLERDREHFKESYEKTKREYDASLSSNRVLNERVNDLELKLHGLQKKVDSYTTTCRQLCALLKLDWNEHGSLDEILPSVRDLQELVKERNVSSGGLQLNEDVGSGFDDPSEPLSLRQGVLVIGLIGAGVVGALAIGAVHLTCPSSETEKYKSSSFFFHGNNSTFQGRRHFFEAEERRGPYIDVVSVVITPSVAEETAYLLSDGKRCEEIMSFEIPSFCEDYSLSHLPVAEVPVPKKTTCGFSVVRDSFRSRMPKNWSQYDCRRPLRGEVKSMTCFTQEQYSTRDIASVNNIQYGCKGKEGCCPPFSYKSRRTGAR